MIRTCAASSDTAIHHIVDVPPCCPVSGNPKIGSTLRVSYLPTAGVVVPVEALAEMVSEYVGGFGRIRAQEEMIQSIAQRCADAVSVPVRVRADLAIAPPFGGDDQRMIVTARAKPETSHDL